MAVLEGKPETAESGSTRRLIPAVNLGSESLAPLGISPARGRGHLRPMLWRAGWGCSRLASGRFAGRVYNARVKRRFDCRGGHVPELGVNAPPTSVRDHSPVLVQAARSPTGILPRRQTDERIGNDIPSSVGTDLEEPTSVGVAGAAGGGTIIDTTPSRVRGDLDFGLVSAGPSSVRFCSSA